MDFIKVFFGGMAALIIGGFILLMLGSIPFNIYSGYQWEKEVENYFLLSDRSSTIDKKLEYLDKYIAVLNERGLTKGDTRLIFKKPSNTLESQYELLVSLRDRLASASTLSPNSLEYQQAISQITNQEYPWVNTCGFADGYYLKKGIMWYLFLGSTGGSCQDGNNSQVTPTN